jgi:hypothetical protein
LEFSTVSSSFGSAAVVAVVIVKPALLLLLLLLSLLDSDAPALAHWHAPRWFASLVSIEIPKDMGHCWYTY